MNFRLRYTSTDTGRIWQVTVTDDEDTGGKYRDLKGTNEITYSHTNSDERIPYSSPINTGELRFGVWIDEVPFDNIHQEEVYNDFEDISDVSLISPCNEGRANELDAFTDIEDLKGDDDQPQNIVDSMAGSDDLRYQVSLQYKDDPNDPFTTEWRGHIIPDLTIYQEDSKPYRATFIARDFSVLSGDYAPGGASSSYETIAQVFAGIFDDFGLNRPFKAVTPFINGELTTAECYLHQVYMSTYQLQDGIADGDRVFISKREALERLLRNHNFILYQSDGYFWLVNMTGMSDANSVFVTEYSTTGAFVSDNTEDLSATPSITTQSTVSISPAIKTVTTRYQHNGTVYGFSFLEEWQTNNTTDTSKVFSGVFLSTGDQRIVFTGTVSATSVGKVTSPEAEVRVKAGQYYWDGSQWTTSPADVVFTMPVGNNDLPDVDNQYTYSAVIDIDTSLVPDNLNTDELEITFFNPTHSGGDFTIANFAGFVFAITDEEIFANNYIDYRESNTGDISVNYDIGKIYYGDRITYNSKSGLRKSSAIDFINGEWKRRGETLESSFQRLLILDILNFYKETKELIQAETFSNYLHWQTISYDGKDYFCTSSSCNIYTGRSTFTMIETAVSTDATDGIIEIPGKPPISGISTLSGVVTRSNYITPSGELKADVTIESGGASGTLSSQIQNLNDDGEFELTKLVKSTDTVFGASGKGLGLFQQSSQQNVSVSANFSITPTGDRIKVNSSTNDVEFQGITYTAGGGERITVIFENAGTNNIIVKHGSTSVLDGYRLYLPGGEDIKVVSDYASMTFEFTNYTSVDEWQLVSYVEYGGITRDVEYTGSTINPVIELTALTADADDYAIGDGTFFSVSMAGFYGGNDITGFAGGVDGREIEVINRGTDAIDIQHQNSGSLVTNRIISPTGADIILNQYDTVRLRYYEGTINRWVIVGGTY